MHGHVHACWRRQRQLQRPSRLNKRVLPSQQEEFDDCGAFDRGQTYDGATTAGTLTTGALSGVVSGDTVTASGTAGALSDADAGSRTCTVTYTLAGDDSGNYNAPADSTNVSCQVNKKNLTIAAPSIAAKTYDGAMTAGTLTTGALSGVVSGDTVTASGTAGALSDADAEAGHARSRTRLLETTAAITTPQQTQQTCLAKSTRRH